MTEHEPLAKLPELTREEMTELAHALATRLRVLDMYRQVAPTEPERDRINARIGLCRSLSTAVLEAANHMR